MSRIRSIEVAYVTTTSGPIQVWRSPQVSELGYLYHAAGSKHGFSRPDQWTDDPAVAEARWRAREEARIKGTEKALERDKANLARGPVWEER